MSVRRYKNLDRDCDAPVYAKKSVALDENGIFCFGLRHHHCNDVVGALLRRSAVIRTGSWF